MTDGNEGEATPPPAPAWLVRGRIFAGGTVTGLAINFVSGTYPSAAPVAVGVAVLVVLAVALELRRFPVDAPLHRLVTRICLGGAVVAVGVSLFGPQGWRNWAVLVAAALGTASCVVPARRSDVFEQLYGVAAVAGGVASIGTAVTLGRVDVLSGVVAVLGGASLVVLGISTHRRSARWVGIGVIGLGTAMAGTGVVLAWTLDLPMTGADVVVAGVSVVLTGICVLRWSSRLFTASAWVFGQAMIGMGAVVLQVAGPLLGVSVTGAGAALVICALAMFQRSERVLGVGTTVAGLSLIGMGFGLLGYNPLLGTGLTGAGVAVAGLGVSVLRGDARLVAWLRSLTVAPR